MNAWESNYKAHQGNLGLGAAIAYYTSKCIPVALPLNDTQGYDLIVDNNGLKRVQVKTTKYKQATSEYYAVQLGNTGGSSGKGRIRKFDNSRSDLLFIVTVEGDLYEIPTTNITSKRVLTLSIDYDRFKVR